MASRADIACTVRRRCPPSVPRGRSSTRRGPNLTRPAAYPGRSSAATVPEGSDSPTLPRRFVDRRDGYRQCRLFDDYRLVVARGRTHERLQQHDGSMRPDLEVQQVVTRVLIVL